MARELEECGNLQCGDFIRFPYGYVCWRVLWVDHHYLGLDGSAYYSSNTFRRDSDYQVTRIV